MHSIPTHILLIGALIAWIGLSLSWSRYIREETEQRRKDAVAQGESPPDIKGVSNYERAELRENAHRNMKVKPREKWISRAVLFVIPVIILTVFFVSNPL